MKQRDHTMQKELQDASEEELKRLDQLSDAQIDSMEGFDQKEEEYITQGGAQYRKINIFNQGDLKNGMMAQVSVADPKDMDTFLPMDKVMVFNFGGKHYATGSFCGFDFTDLNNGVYLGDKIICPTCGSVYNITNGLIEQGPSMRNISSFPMQTRKKKVNMIVPDHIPAYSIREHLTREDIDPRTMIVIGDSEAALSAIITLRYAFTGRIILVPTSTTGSFENKDVLIRKFGPINKEEVYFVEPDLFKKANVEVKNEKVLKIDHDNREVSFSDKTTIPFDGILFAGSSDRPSLGNYINVHTITDFESHAKAHNKVIKSNHTLVLGGTFEAFQLANSINTYLTSIKFNDIKLTLMENKNSEISRTLGIQIARRIRQEMREVGIRIVEGAEITNLEGDHVLKKIHFKMFSKPGSNFYLSPDCIISESVLGKVDHSFHSKIFFDKPKHRPELDANLAFKIDQRFSICLGMNYWEMYACGQNALHRSFMRNDLIRTPDVKFNIESGFYAALNMMHKDIRMEYLPLSRLTINNKEIYYYGERNNQYDRIIVSGDALKDDKFVVYYINGGVVSGFLTFGYTNLHLFLMEAMKMLLMPTGKLSASVIIFGRPRT